MAFLKTLYIKTDKPKVRQLEFELSAHLSCFTEETKLIWKLEDNISSTRKNKTKLTAKKHKNIFFPSQLAMGPRVSFLRKVFSHIQLPTVLVLLQKAIKLP